MPWAMLSDDFHSNPKVIALGLDGAGLYSRAISYCADHATDGFVTLEWALGVTKGKRPLLRKLTEKGAWMELKQREQVTVIDRSENEIVVVATEPGFLIRDFVQFNFSTVELEQRSEEKRKAGRKGAHSRWHGSSHGKRIAPAMAEAKQEPPRNDGKTMAPRARVPNPNQNTALGEDHESASLFAVTEGPNGSGPLADEVAEALAVVDPQERNEP